MLKYLVEAKSLARENKKNLLRKPRPLKRANDRLEKSKENIVREGKMKTFYPLPLKGRSPVRRGPGINKGVTGESWEDINPNLQRNFDADITLNRDEPSQEDIKEIAKEKPAHMDIRMEVERLRGLGAPWQTVLTSARHRFVEDAKGLDKEEKGHLSDLIRLTIHETKMNEKLGQVAYSRRLEE